MAIKKISQFTSGTPTDNDYILFEQNGAGKSTKFGDFSLTYEEIMASTGLTGKVTSADALKVASQILGVPDYSKAVLIDNTKTAVSMNYVAPSNGIIVGSGYGYSQTNSQIYFSVGSVKFQQQGSADEYINVSIPVAKGDTVLIQTSLAQSNLGTYFVPYK